MFVGFCCLGLVLGLFDWLVDVRCVTGVWWGLVCAWLRVSCVTVLVCFVALLLCLVVLVFGLVCLWGGVCCGFLALSCLVVALFAGWFSCCFGFCDFCVLPGVW